MDLTLWKQRKKELKLKYEDISNVSGIPLTTVKNIFCGYVKTPRIDSVRIIFGIDNVYTAEDYANGVTDTKKVGITADQEDILDKTTEVMEVLGEKGKELIIEFCNMLLEKFGK